MSTVLVVDDAAVDRVIAGRCLEAAGCQAVFATHGGEALEIVARDRPDAVLTDLQMPEMDGLELVRCLRRDYPTLPCILMTACGSEETAVLALREGAVSYVPKQNLRHGLEESLKIVMEVTRTAQHRQTVNALFRQGETQYVLGYEPGAAAALVSHLQDGLAQIEFCDEAEVLRVGTALSEALVNAVDHGNLELDSALREESDSAYRELGNQRAATSPYRDRSVHVTARLSQAEATYVIRDEGPGFDPTQLPDPTDPENLLRPSGRGIMLIRTFMDDVSFNERGNEITLRKCKPAAAG